MSRMWARQIAFLACIAVVVFWGFYAFDYFALSRDDAPDVAGPLSRYFLFNSDAVVNAIASLPEVNAAVFGIVIMVVSIIVQLTAERYTGVARMFLRDRVNLMVAAYYVVTCVTSVWASMSVQPDYVPRATIAAALSLTTGAIVIMAPYFGYVFWFLEPRHIIARIRREAVASVSGALKEDEEECSEAQARSLFALEELTDITNNSISGKDKIIAGGAVDALKDFALEYLKMKSRASAVWFRIGAKIRHNPDFVAMDPESLADLELRRTWVEWKVMRQYLTIYNEALGSMRDINYLIAIDTRYIGEEAARANDNELVELVYRYLNSYIRATLNARDIRTTYNVLNQYRKLVESLLKIGQDKAALYGVRHMKFYGIVGFDMNLNFVTETVGYDISAIAQLANELGSPVEKEIIDELLELDRAPFARGQEKSLLGVRKAQVKLAAYYLASGQEERARSIANDMKQEPRERLLAIRNQLSAVESKEYWEIIDRGRNFEYMPPNQRAGLTTFFEWLDVGAPAAGQPPIELRRG
jgi:hypothetical protein